MWWKSMMMNGRVTSLTIYKKNVQITLVQTIPEIEDEFRIEMNHSSYEKLGKLNIGAEVDYHILTNDKFLKGKKLSKKQEKLRREGILWDIKYRDIPMSYLSMNVQKPKGLKEIFSDPWIDAKLLSWKNKDKH